MLKIQTFILAALVLVTVLAAQQVQAANFVHGRILAEVPEPASLGILAVGSMVLLFKRRGR